MKTTLILMASLLLLVGGCNHATAPADAGDSAKLDIAEEALPFDSELLDTDELTPEEIAGLVFMREEEKMARDVYLVFAEQYGARVFSSIASSEETHTTVILSLLQLYGIDDPVGDNPVGVFTDPDLQALYDQLVEQGAASLESALLVGGLIEEVDILDLEERAAQTEAEDLLWVYTRLESASGNHLRAFVRNYENLAGVEYVPQQLSPEAYAAIIEAGGPGNGNAGNGRRGGGRGRR